MLNDAELLRIYAKNGSQEAFSELVRRYINLVYFAALRRTDGNAQLASDVTQSVFISLATDAAPLSRYTVLTGWLYTATRNQAITLIRSEKRRRAREEAYHKMHEIPSPGQQSPDWDRLRPQLDEAMDELGHRDRQAVLLRFFDARPFAEIGEILRLSPDAARKRVDRALDKLRSAFARRGITSTSAALAELLSSQGAGAAPAGLMTTVVNAAAAAAGNIGVGGVATVGLFSFMSTAKTIATVAAVLSLGIALYELEAIRTEKAVIAQLNRQQATKVQQLQKLELTARTADSRVAPIATPAATIRASNDTVQAGRANAKAFLKQYPQAREMLLKSTIQTMANYYAPFFGTAGLSQAQIDEFLNRTAQLDISSLQINPGGAWHFDWTNLPSDDARSILGDPAYQQLQEANRTLPAQFWSMNLAATISSFATPLSSEQIGTITQIVAANNPDYVSGGSVNPQSIDPDSIFAQAKAVMSDSQWQAAQTWLATLELRRQLQTLKPATP